MTDEARPSLFQHGVASGDPTPRRVVIWTRVTAPPPHAPAAAFWRVMEADTGRPVANGQTRVRAEADNTIRVDVGGLRPDTRYVYEFEVDSEASPRGRTRTLPEGDVAAIRFGQVSCAKYIAGHFNAYARLAERDDLQFVLHLGDWIYEASQTPPASQTASSDIGRPFDPPHECVTLDDYRRRYAQYRSDPDVQAVSAAHPIVATVDDHEFADGAWRDGATEHKPERDGPWAERRAAAFRAREEWLPVRRPVMTEPERAFRSVQIGDLAELFLIDTRTRRDQPVPPPASNKPGRTALGPEQKAWLVDGLRSSRARWRLIGNPSVMTRTWNDRLPRSVRDALVKVKLIDPDGVGPDWDQWDGYPHERRELLDLISRLDVANVVVLSGDVHVCLAAELAETPAEPPVAVEFVNTSLTSQNLDDKMGWALRRESLEVEKAFLAGMPHIRYVDFDSHGYSIVHVDRDAVRFEWWNVGGLETRVPEQALAAAISVRHGTPRLVVEGEPASGATDPPAAGSAAKPAKAPKPAAQTPASASKPAPTATKPAPSIPPRPAKPTRSTKAPTLAPSTEPGKPGKPAKPARPGTPPKPPTTRTLKRPRRSKQP
ncbi:MAG TPA: alkaline phosphatase D family protein [Candidatus Binatia bacterium]|nr:alkaline phosphatase D family protein [Candidatus Binatia bacterium]